MKWIKFALFVLIFYSCQRNAKIEAFGEYVNTIYLNSKEKGNFIIFKEPGCGSCNSSFKNYLDTILDIKDYSLIYLVKYPDEKIVNFWSEKFGDKFILDKNDFLFNLNEGINKSGKLIFNKEILRFYPFDPNEKSIEVFL